MYVVIDANIILAMLVSPGIPIDVFFSDHLKVVAPYLLFEELENNKEEIVEKSKLSEEEFSGLFLILKSNVEVIPGDIFLKYRTEAEKICPDSKDIVYFALALYFNCPIWSSEKKLKEQNYVKVYSTHELVGMLRFISLN